MTFMLLGNGYDLHHKFPTRYIDFLQTVHFLMEQESAAFNTVGAVFGHEELQNRNDFIKEAYLLHSETYNQTPLEPKTLTEMIELAKSNMWFNYLFSAINMDIGWIDFEEQIAIVLETFANFFSGEEKILFNGSNFIFNLVEFPENNQGRFIVQKFDFFFARDNSFFAAMPGSNMQIVDKKYILEEPIGSKHFRLNVEKIVNALYNSLVDLSNILRIYLKCFIDMPSKFMRKNGIRVRCASYPDANHIFTFNYTNTFEILNGSTNAIEHIHGNVDNDIILGVNPNENDELYNIDTTFIQFKKYCQRIFFRTDVSYLRKIKALQITNRCDNGNSLYVVGHSLDITDKDVIMQLFDMANRILILFHSPPAVKGYIKNLVEIYGKEEFDRLRARKDLQFMPLAEMDWS